MTDGSANHLIKGLPWYLGSGTSVRKWDFSYGTSSCITYFKLREH